MYKLTLTYQVKKQTSTITTKRSHYTRMGVINEALAKSILINIEYRVQDSSCFHPHKRSLKNMKEPSPQLHLDKK